MFKEEKENYINIDLEMISFWVIKVFVIHFNLIARKYLDKMFPRQWIDKGGPIAWPSRSPDLNHWISFCQVMQSL